MNQNNKSELQESPKLPSGRSRRNKGLILIVEDDFDIAKMLKIYFDSLEYETLIERQGAAGVAACLKNLPDVVILGMSLADMSGSQVYELLQTEPKTQHIPVVFLPEEQEAHEKDAFVTTPFYLEALKGQIKQVISKGLSK